MKWSLIVQNLISPLPFKPFFKELCFVWWRRNWHSVSFFPCMRSGWFKVKLATLQPRWERVQHQQPWDCWRTQTWKDQTSAQGTHWKLMHTHVVYCDLLSTGPLSFTSLHDNRMSLYNRVRSHAFGVTPPISRLWLEHIFFHTCDYPFKNTPSWAVTMLSLLHIRNCTLLHSSNFMCVSQSFFTEW